MGSIVRRDGGGIWNIIGSNANLFQSCNLAAPALPGAHPVLPADTPQSSTSYQWNIHPSPQYDTIVEKFSTELMSRQKIQFLYSAKNSTKIKVKTMEDMEKSLALT